MNDKNIKWAKNVLEKTLKKLEVVAERHKDGFPAICRDRKTYINEEGIYWWTNGFWPGMMWIMYKITGEEKYRRYAESCEQQLDEALNGYEDLHHDVGFMWLTSAVANYRITGNKESYIRGMKAASVLASRFNLKGEFIRAWPNWQEIVEDTVIGEIDNRGLVIIDCMMNIPILYWASREEDDPRFAMIAEAHANTVIREFVREDGSCNHMVRFDEYTGEVLEKPRGQGYAEGSSWTRGQAWAIYGFALSYIHTKKEKYLETAKAVADYFIAEFDKNGNVPCDFTSPKNPYIPDSSAASASACGLIEIAKALPENEGEKYIDKAVEILKWLENECADYSMETDVLLKHATGEYHDLKSRDIAYIFGDYYWLEALWKLSGEDLLLW